MNSLYTVKGKVKDGKKRGKDLGFPTINMSLDQSIPEGIYVSYVRLADKTYNALTFIGAAITFGETQIIAETYLLDFTKDIYDEEVEVELLKKLRDNKKFANKEDLVQQMELDKKMAEEFFK